MGINLVDQLLVKISYFLNTPVEQINFVFCMLLTYIPGYINRYISKIKSRLILGAISGILIQYQMYGNSIIHLIFATFYTHFFIFYFGRKFSSFYVLIFTIIHLLYLHIDVLINRYGSWSLGVEVNYMMSICKFSSLAFSYEDGGKDDLQLKSNYYKKNSIKEKPTILETFSYIFYYPTCITGPSFEFSDFLKFIRLQEEYKNINWKECNKSALENLFWTLIFICLKVTYAEASDPLYTATAEFYEKPFYYKYFFVYFSIFITRCRYYLAWKICQGSVNFSGLGYDYKLDKDGNMKASFDKMDVCNLYVMEFSINPKTKLQYWNRSVHVWLKYHVYLRLINIQYFNNKKGVVSFITFCVSAIWHGFYISYYLFFIQFYFIEQITSYLEEKFDLFEIIDKSNIFIKFISWNCVMSVLIYFGHTFTLLNPQSVFNYYKAFYFIPNLVLFFIFIYVSVIRKSKSQPRKIK